MSSSLTAPEQSASLRTVATDAELMVFYCERASGLSVEVGLQDEGFPSALV
jgi:hypothetical protein